MKRPNGNIERERSNYDSIALKGFENRRMPVG
jgi:hypothetical protein